MRVPSQLLVGRLLLLLFFSCLFVECAVADVKTPATSSSSSNNQDATTTTTSTNNNKNSGADSSANVCYNFGCPFLPRDVFYDEDAKVALHRLKEPTRKLHIAEQDLSTTSIQFLSELDSSGDRHRTTMTLCGYKGGSINAQINQDRSILVSPFMSEYQLLGVLDGHGAGGELISEFARNEIPKQLAAQLEELLARDDGRQNLMNINADMEDAISNILKYIFIQVDKAAPEASHGGGCTASIVLQLGAKLFVANAGDSTTMIAAHRGWNETSHIVYRTREDKPHLPEERKRIEKAGGRVQIPQSYDDGDSSRVVYNDPRSNENIGLAMSRSIGDWDAPGVTAEPIVDVLDLRELAKTVLAGKDEFDCETSKAECGPPDVNFFIVSATDGLMDFATPQMIADKVGVTFFGRPDFQDRQSGLGAGHAHLAAEELIYHAARGWHEAMQGSYRDDITIAISKVFPFTQEEES